MNDPTAAAAPRPAWLKQLPQYYIDDLNAGKADGPYVKLQDVLAACPPQQEEQSAKDTKAERVFQAVVYAYEGRDVPADLEDHGFVKRARKHLAEQLLIHQVNKRRAEAAEELRATSPPPAEARDEEQELYDATTLLWAALTFTHETADLLKPELDYACRRLIAARAALRRTTRVIHTEAGLLSTPALPPPFDQPAEAVLRETARTGRAPGRPEGPHG